MTRPLEAQNIIRKPIITEKSMRQSDTQDIYAFEVDERANKIQVRKAVEELFEVRVVRVNLISMKGKTRRHRYRAGKTRTWKKALVKVAEGDRIEVL